MKIATWNVNSLRVRLPHVLDWLQEKLAVLALDVTQCRCRLGKVDWLSPVNGNGKSDALLDISV